MDSMKETPFGEWHGPIDWRRLPERASRTAELTVFAVIVALFNLPLLKGEFSESLIYSPQSVAAGNWWTVVTHPFVHLSWYHLLLDAGSFLLLYGGLEERRLARRLFYVVGCGMGSLGLSLLTSPLLPSLGLCGLSGIAHGLMAVSALETLVHANADSRSRVISLASLAIVAGKSILEMLQGHVFFESLHLGLMGRPIPECHMGGVMAGVLGFFLLYRRAPRREGASATRLSEGARPDLNEEGLSEEAGIEQTKRQPKQRAKNRIVGSPGKQESEHGKGGIEHDRAITRRDALAHQEHHRGGSVQRQQGNQVEREENEIERKDDAHQDRHALPQPG